MLGMWCMVAIAVTATFAVATPTGIPLGCASIPNATHPPAMAEAIRESGDRRIRRMLRVLPLLRQHCPATRHRTASAGIFALRRRRVPLVEHHRVVIGEFFANRD